MQELFFVPRGTKHHRATGANETVAAQQVENYRSTVASIGETVKALRDARRWTQADLARAAGLSSRFVSSLENGSNVTLDVLRRVATALDVPLVRMLGADDARDDTEPPRQATHAPPPPIMLGGNLEVVDVQPAYVGKPVVAYVAAGYAGWEDVSGGEVVMLPEFLLGPDDFVCQVRGESLIDEDIQDGDYLIVERRPSGIAQHGDLVVAWLNDGLVIKRWYRRGGKKFLESANAELGWQPRELRPDDVFEIQGIVRHIVRRANRKTKADRVPPSDVTGGDDEPPGMMPGELSRHRR